MGDVLQDYLDSKAKPIANAAPGDSKASPIGNAAPGASSADPLENYLTGATVDVGPEARRAAAGKPREPPAPADAVAMQPTEDPAVTAHRRRATDENPFAGDPLARMIATGIVGGGVGAVAGGGAAALGAGPVATAVTTGVVGGGSTAALSGGSAKDVALGAALGGGFAALSPLMAGAAKRVSEDTFQEYAAAAKGAGKGKTLAKLEGLGADKVADVLDRNGIGSIADAPAARAATKAALANTGQQMGAALDVIDAVPTKTTLGDAMTKLGELHKTLAADENTKPLAEALHKYMRDFWDANGAKATATIDAKALHGKISALEATGYAGAGTTLSPAAAKVVARKTAGVLNEVLDEQIASAAKANPAAADAAAKLAKLTQDYRVLKTVQPIVANQAIAQRFAPGYAATVGKAMEHGVLPAAKAAVTPAVSAVASIPANIDRALAKLYAAPVVTPELVQEAIQSGVAPATLSAIASLRKARAAAPVPAVAQ